MRALTITQPWATLIALGAKQIETRSWRTDYRGPVAIHAGAGLGPVGGERGLVELCQTEPFQSVLALRGVAWGNLVLRSQLPRGAVVAVATLMDCQPMIPGATAYALHNGRQVKAWRLTDEERAFGDYSPGRYAWLLADVRPLREPVPCRGALGLWRPTSDIAAAVRAQLTEVAP